MAVTTCMCLHDLQLLSACPVPTPLGTSCSSLHLTRNTSTVQMQVGHMDEDQRLSSHAQDRESSMQASAAPGAVAALTSGSNAVAGGDTNAPSSHIAGGDSIMTDTAAKEEAIPTEHASGAVVVEESATPGMGAEADSGTSEVQATQAASAAASTTKKADANLKVWKPFSGMPPRIPDLPDSFYNPTAGQLRAAQAGQSSRLKSMGVGTDFSTRKQREDEQREKELARIRRYPKTIIRVRFHDRHQIETIFPSSSTIKSVYNFVKAALNEETRAEPFLLYTPPRTEYKLTDKQVEGKSLLDLQLAPSSVLLVRFSRDTLNDSNKTAPLKAELLELAQDLPQAPTFDRTAEQAKGDSSEKPDDGKGKGKTLGEGKVPKWLQKAVKK